MGDDGCEYTIDVYHTIIETTTSSGLSRTPTDPRYECNGLWVNRTEKGKYEVFDTGLKLTSDDPNAP